MYILAEYMIYTFVYREKDIQITYIHIKIGIMYIFKTNINFCLSLFHFKALQIYYIQLMRLNKSGINQS